MLPRGALEDAFAKAAHVPFGFLFLPESIYVIDSDVFISAKNSYYAFTAAPKFKTRALFDEPGPSGASPFHEYSMRQAIEEGFIMDVLANYVTDRRGDFLSGDDGYRVPLGGA